MRPDSSNESWVAQADARIKIAARELINLLFLVSSLAALVSEQAIGR